MDGTAAFALAADHPALLSAPVMYLAFWKRSEARVTGRHCAPTLQARFSFRPTTQIAKKTSSTECPRPHNTSWCRPSDMTRLHALAPQILDREIEWIGALRPAESAGAGQRHHRSFLTITPK